MMALISYPGLIPGWYQEKNGVLDIEENIDENIWVFLELEIFIYKGTSLIFPLLGFYYIYTLYLYIYTTYLYFVIYIIFAV